jgi:hypothetical protein
LTFLSFTGVLYSQNNPYATHTLQNRELTISAPKKIEVTGGRRNVHNDKLCNLYSAQSIIRMIKSRRLRWEGYVARMVEKKTHVGYWW